MAIATTSTPDSAYITSAFNSGDEGIVTITLDVPLATPLGLHHVSVFDFALSRLRLGPVDTGVFLSQESPTVYKIRYTSSFPVTKVSLVLNHPEITNSGFNIGDYTVGPLPQDLTFDPEKAFLFNGETTTVAFTVNLRNRSLHFVNLSVTAGTLSNFRGSGPDYRVDVTAPVEGVGLIELQISGFTTQLIEEFLYAPRPTEDIVYVSKVHPLPELNRDDSVLVIKELTASDDDGLYDFKVLILFNQDVTGFTEDDITVRAIDANNDVVKASVVDFSGKGSVYEATIRVLSTGGEGTVVISVPLDAVDQGNPIKSLTLTYSDELVIPGWQDMFTTADTYNDIVSVSQDGIQLLREDYIDFFAFDGTLDSTRRVALPNTPVVTRVVNYDVDKYMGLSTVTNEAKAYLFVGGATDWESASVFTLATDRANDPNTEIIGLAVNDWVWTQERRLFLASMPFQTQNARIGSVDALEIHSAIRERTDLNDVVFGMVSVDYGDLDFDAWNGLISLAHAEGKLFVGSNETGTDEQNYIFVFDADAMLIAGQQIPITGRVKSLFAKDGYLYRYNDTEKRVLRFALDRLRLPEPKKEIYPQLVRPGDEIDLLKLIRYARRVVFDVGFEKPPWLSIEDNKLKVAADATVKSTAYVRLRGINRNGASVAGSCGFYVYVRELRGPVWKDFEKISIYPNQELNMHAYVEGADTIEWQEGFSAPTGFVLEDGKVKGG